VCTENNVGEVCVIEALGFEIGGQRKMKGMGCFSVT
jgi:hypothetical protein